METSGYRVRYGVRDPETSKAEGKKGGSSAGGAYMYNNIQDRLPEPNLYSMKLELVGVEKELHEIREHVKWSSWEGPKVLCIVGHAGTGKSTMAMALYHELVGQFDNGAVVSLSGMYDPHTILKSVLIRLKSQDDGNQQKFFGDARKKQPAGLALTRRILVPFCGPELQQRRDEQNIDINATDEEQLLHAIAACFRCMRYITFRDL